MKAFGARLLAAQTATLRGTRPAMGAAAPPDAPESGEGAPQMTILPQRTGPNLNDAASAAGSHYCPHCLKRVRATLAQRRAHHETCASGTLDVVLLHCPACGLALAAEAEPRSTWSQTVA